MGVVLKIILAASIAALGLTGCVTSTSGDTILALQADRAANASVGEIVLTGAPDTVSPAFATVFQREVRERLSECARGDTPLRMEVRVTELQTSNPAMTYFAGGSNVIRAQVALIEPATGAKVGDYEVSRSVGGGGLVAALALAEAEEQMSRELATDVCERAFGYSPYRRRR